MRHVVLVLLLIANAGYFAWTSGWLRNWGLAPSTQSEPQRLAQQIRPEALRILGTGNAPLPAMPKATPADMTPAPATMDSSATNTTTPAVPPASNGVAAVAAAVRAAASIAAMASVSAAAPAQPVQQTP
ncbi:MAG: hypothetical protein ABJB17_04450 [Burkholderiales bacterium]